MFIFNLVLFLVVAIANAREYFDLSYSLNNDTIYFPGQKMEFELHKDVRGYTKTGYWYATYSLCLGEHGGTHVDSPYHFSPDGWTLDQIPASHMIDVPATVVDMEDATFSSPNPGKFLLKVEHLLQHEARNGEIPNRGVVLLHTGWAKYWPDKVRYLGWDNSSSEATPRMNFPGCSEEAAKWLVHERNIVGFGIDTPSVDIGDNEGHYPVHILHGKEQIYNIENVANLHLVLRAYKENPNCSLRLFVLPLKLTGGTGAPTRIIAYCKQH